MEFGLGFFYVVAHGSFGGSIMWVFPISLSVEVRVKA